MIVNKDNITAKHALYKQYEVAWEKADDLDGGVVKMRGANTRYLPKNPEESPEKYTARKGRTFLWPGHKKAISRAVSKPFSRPVTVEDMPDKLSMIEGAADNGGRDLSQFLKAVMTAGLRHGLSHILVEYPPQVLKADGTKLTVTEEAKLQLRPYWTHIEAPNLYDWEYRIDGGAIVMTAIKFREWVSRESDTGSIQVERIRVHREDSWEVWEFVKDSWVPVGNGVNTLGKITLATFYADQTGFMQTEFVFDDLADLNIAHWQADSNLNNNLYYSGQINFIATGITKEEQETGFVVGGNAALTSINEQAKFGYAEHTGKAASVLRESRKDLEEKMEILGVQPLFRRTVGGTATGQAINYGDAVSDIEVWIRTLEATAKMAYGFTAEWLKTELNEKSNVNIYSDFAVGVAQENDISELLKAVVANKIPIDTFQREWKLRGMLSENEDVDTMVAQVDAAELSPSIPPEVE